MRSPRPDPPWHVRIVQAVGWTIVGSVAVIGILIAILVVAGLSLLAAAGAFDPWPLVLYGAAGGLLIAIVLTALATDVETGLLSGLILLGPWALGVLVLVVIGGERSAATESLGLGFGLGLGVVLAGIVLVAVRRDRGEGERDEEE